MELELAVIMAVVQGGSALLHPNLYLDGPLDYKQALRLGVDRPSKLSAGWISSAEAFSWRAWSMLPQSTP